MTRRAFWAVVLLCKALKCDKESSVRTDPRWNRKGCQLCFTGAPQCPEKKNALQLVSGKITVMHSVKMSPIFYHYHHNLHVQQTLSETFQLNQKRKANCLCKKAFMCIDAS